MRTPLFRSFPRLKLFAANLVLILLLAPAIAAQTQSTTGVIEVVVTDPNGAFVPGATVEIKNLDTNLTRTETTDDNGRFVALAMPPGRYTVSVNKQGFAPAVFKESQLTVGQNLQLRARSEERRV